MRQDVRQRFYADLAVWWPLISPVSHYEGEAAYLASLLNEAVVPVRDVLELGSGGGHNAFWLRRHFALTLTDLSEDMLDVSRALNPDCTHLHADMRTLRLDRQFDAVLIHDAIDYMSSPLHLRNAMATAHHHCRVGGVVVLVPDHVTETFVPETAHGGVDAPDGRSVRYLEWSTDPDPEDDWVQTDYVFVLRDEHGRTETVHEVHRTGLFATERWLELLADVGLRGEMRIEATDEARPPRRLFLGHRDS
ncbi:MAG TPA: class I SAM-dependent methyltransferase [Pseudomonadales bacterium]|nr:class I SAM-dependent methyltransferase [Pseudomonadales bacterium]